MVPAAKIGVPAVLALIHSLIVAEIHGVIRTWLKGLTRPRPSPLDSLSLSDEVCPCTCRSHSHLDAFHGFDSSYLFNFYDRPFVAVNEINHPHIAVLSQPFVLGKWYDLCERITTVAQFQQLWAFPEPEFARGGFNILDESSTSSFFSVIIACRILQENVLQFS